MTETRDVKIGQTDFTVLADIRDTDGAPATGLVYTDIDASYTRAETDNDVTVADVTPATLASLTAVHADWGFIEVDATKAPGLYRFDPADAPFATGAWSAVITITGTGLDPYKLHAVLVPESPYAGVMPSTAGILAIWSFIIEGTMTAREFLRGILAGLIAKLSGANTGTTTIRNVTDTKNRFVVSTDTTGRTAVTMDLTESGD
jgi:hypothetical protein